MITELKKAAEDCNAFCNKCGYIGKSEPYHTRIPTATWVTECGYQAMRMMYVHNATVLKLIAVVEAAYTQTPPNQQLQAALKELES